MCAYKTGVLARLSARLGALLAGADDKFINAIGIFAEAIGVAFQIQDDLLNISGGLKIEMVGEDVHEGKRSLMVIHSLQHSSKEKADRLIEILNSKTNDPQVIQEAIDLMKDSNSLEYAKQVAKDIVTKAWNEIEPLLPDCEAKEKIRIFANYLIERKI